MITNKKSYIFLLKLFLFKGFSIFVKRCSNLHSFVSKQIKP